MAVAVQGRQNLSKEKDPLDQILKGLEIASKVYGISEAGDKLKVLQAQKEQNDKKEALEAEIKMASAGLRKNEKGGVEENPDSLIFQKKTAVPDTSLGDAVKALTIESLKNKNAEVGSAQAKQGGLAKSGLLAEKQYQEATADSKEYDPTSVADAARNIGPNVTMTDRAQQAEAAQAAWVEAYLRDASGAAIAPSERMNYAKDFFPRAGDSPAVVKNKAELRRQKMENAVVGAGPKFEKQSRQQDVDDYAQKHNITYEQALSIKQGRSK